MLNVELRFNVSCLSVGIFNTIITQISLHQIHQSSLSQFATAPFHMFPESAGGVTEETDASLVLSAAFVFSVGCSLLSHTQHDVSFPITPARCLLPQSVHVTV